MLWCCVQHFNIKQADAAGGAALHRQTVLILKTTTPFIKKILTSTSFTSCCRLAPAAAAAAGGAAAVEKKGLWLGRMGMDGREKEGIAPCVNEAAPMPDIAAVPVCGEELR